MKANTGRVILITGASSGIGRLTAHGFAREGASLVLAARQLAALEDAARECRALGARETVVVETDVAEPGDVDRLAARAVADFGRIDVWVNNAGVTALGRFEDTPPDVFRRVVETNLFGCVHGARAAMRIFRKQGRGVLINMSSMLGVVGEPYASAYVASKFAIRGFSESLRQEVLDAPGIRICTVLPAAMDTPIFRWAANYALRPAKAVAPVYDARRTARLVVRLSHRPRREAVAGGFGRLLMLGRRVWPSLTEHAIARATPGLQFARGNGERPPTAGNVFVPAPAGGHAVTGAWPRTRSGVLVLAGGAVLVAALLWRSARSADRTTPRPATRGRKA